MVCGRFALTENAEVVSECFRVDSVSPRLFEVLRPRYNIAPSRSVLAVVDDEEGRRTDMFRWGFVPRWAKDPTIGYRMINARSETAAEKPSFREAFERRRCVIPASGFYEWRKDGGHKRPHYIRPAFDEVFALAGLWESWKPKDAENGEPIDTCIILTTNPNALMKPIHDRMPVILDFDSLDLWLDREAPGEAVQHLLGAYPEERMHAYEVSTQVNSPKNDGPKCVEAV